MTDDREFCLDNDDRVLGEKCVHGQSCHHKTGNHTIPMQIN